MESRTADGPDDDRQHDEAAEQAAVEIDTPTVSLTPAVATGAARAPTSDQTLQVHIHALGPELVAPVTFQHGARVLSSTFRLPTAAPVHDWAHLEAGERQGAAQRATGAALFNALFHEDHTRNLFHEVAAGGAFVRVRMITADPRVSGLAWELMVNPSTGEYVTRGGSLVRWLVAQGSMPVPSMPLAVAGPVRALVIWSSPPDDPLPRVRDEAEEIGRAYEESADGGGNEVVVLANPDRRAVVDCLREAEVAGRPFHVLHYAGHAAIDDRGRGLIRLSGPDGVVDAQELANFVRDSNLRLVVLNACAAMGSGSGLPAVPDFARRLTGVGIPAVVGMQTLVADDFAATVGRDFHAALLDGRSVDHALTDVRRLVDDDTSAAASNLGIPVLFLAPGQSRLVVVADGVDGVEDDEPAPGPGSSSWEWLLRHKRQAAWATLAVIIPLIFTYLDIFDRVADWRAGPAPMEAMVGDLNVAVAGFAGQDPEVTSAFDGLDQSVHARLSDTLGCGESGVGTGSGSVELQYGCR
ncbi:MAG TPA: CHAT domain-containing protein, partial [Nitriliruptoraceae bacterium]|nr:CHAT domain-containing protein [Nitriliruptoraceae bacterium]